VGCGDADGAERAGVGCADTGCACADTSAGWEGSFQILVSSATPPTTRTALRVAFPVATYRPQMISTLNRPFWALKMTTAP